MGGGVDSRELCSLALGGGGGGGLLGLDRGETAA